MAKIFIVTLALIAVAHCAVIYPAAVSYQNSNLRSFAYPSQQYLATGVIASAALPYSTQSQQQQYYNQQNPGQYQQQQQQQQHGYHAQQYNQRSNEGQENANYAHQITSAAYTNAADFTTTGTNYDNNNNNYRTNYGTNYNNEEQRRY